MSREWITSVVNCIELTVFDYFCGIMLPGSVKTTTGIISPIKRFNNLYEIPDQLDHPQNTQEVPAIIQSYCFKNSVSAIPGRQSGLSGMFAGVSEIYAVWQKASGECIMPKLPGAGKTPFVMVIFAEKNRFFFCSPADVAHCSRDLFHTSV